MLRIKKSLLIFLIIFALICGGAGSFILLRTGIGDALPGSTVTITRAQHERYRDYAERYEKAELLRKYIEENYYIEVDDEALMESIYKGIFAGLNDPYSGYLTAEEYAEELLSISGEYSGVGVTITNDKESGRIMVVSPTPNSPAERAGVRSGDYILKVDGVSYIGEQYSDAAFMIRGEEGSEVTITFKRGDQIFDLTLVRAQIQMLSVSHEMIDAEIGYIQISQFIEPTGKDFKEALDEIEESDAEGFVIDLRNNGGGLVDRAVEVADCLMDRATVVYAEDNAGKRTYYKTRNGKTDLPFVVLINEGTASASEILAAGLQDNDACPVVGTKSFGKGIIQQMEDLRDGSAVKLTVMQYFSPSGRTIHKKGITPDYIIKLDESCYDEEGFLADDLQLDKALSLLRTRIAAGE